MTDAWSGIGDQAGERKRLFSPITSPLIDRTQFKRTVILMKKRETEADPPSNPTVKSIEIVIEREGERKRGIDLVKR